MQKLYKRQQGLQTGGLTNIGYKLNQYPLIQGFGAKKSVGRPRKSFYGYGEETEQHVEPEIIAEKKKGRPKHTSQFSTNITENLNSLLGNLRLQEAEIRQRELDPELKKAELKNVRKMQRDLTKIYLNCA